jgi:hypothetical protein
MNGPGSENKKTDDEGGAADGVPAVDSSIQGLLGRKLRENYEEVVKEEVPQKFLQLLEELKRKEKADKNESGS